jgi:hypothetical protein
LLDEGDCVCFIGGCGAVDRVERGLEGDMCVFEAVGECVEVGGAEDEGVAEGAAVEYVGAF